MAHTIRRQLPELPELPELVVFAVTFAYLNLK